MKFKSAINDPAANNVSLFSLNLPGSVAPDIHLMKHITMINGMTINDIGSNEYIDNVMFCSRGPNPRCIKFPDQDGNTVLTSLKSGSRIILDGDSDLQGVFNLKSSGLQYGNINGITSTTGTDMQISSSNNMIFKPIGGKVGISTTAPTATLHVESLSAVNDGLRISCANGKNVYVDKDGTLNVEKIKIGNSFIEKGTNNKLLITATDGIVVNTGTVNNTTFENAVIGTVTAPTAA
jgi:hypothetical protein